MYKQLIFPSLTDKQKLSKQLCMRKEFIAQLLLF